MDFLVSLGLIIGSIQALLFMTLTGAITMLLVQCIQYDVLQKIARYLDTHTR